MTKDCGGGAGFEFSAAVNLDARKRSMNKCFISKLDFAESDSDFGIRTSLGLRHSGFGFLLNLHFLHRPEPKQPPTDWMSDPFRYDAANVPITDPESLAFSAIDPAAALIRDERETCHKRLK